MRGNNQQEERANMKEGETKKFSQQEGQNKEKEEGKGAHEVQITEYSGYYTEGSVCLSEQSVSQSE